MSMKAIVAAVALAFGLIVLAFFVNRAQPGGQQGASGPEQLLDFKPAQVVRVITTTPEGTHTVVRNEDMSWSYLGPSGDTWPARPTDRDLTALGRLSTLESVSPAPDQTLPDEASLIQVELSDGSIRTVRYSREALGGKVLASVESSEDETDESTLHLVNQGDILPLAVPGPESWRLKAALPGVRDASRITIESGGQTIQLAKLDGRWTVRRPVSHRANEQAVASLLDTLAQLRVNQFLDSDRPTMSNAGIATPRMALTYEEDVRSVDDQGRTRTTIESRTILVGDATDASADTLYAAPSATSDFLVTFPADLVTMISTAPRNYLALTATDLPAEDIGLITVLTGYDEPTQRGFRRVRGEWMELMPDGTMDEADDEAVEELIAFLREEPGEPEPASTDAITPAGRVTLHDASGRPLEAIAFTYTADGTLFARTGNVDVLYYDFSAPRLLDLPSATAAPSEPIERPAITVPENAPSDK